MNPPILHIHLVAKQFNQEILELAARLLETGITCALHRGEIDLGEIQTLEPWVFLSIGENATEFSSLSQLPPDNRKRWIHFRTPEEVTPLTLLSCWTAVSEPSAVITTHDPLSRAGEPLISVFTAAYRTGDLIERPYRSLLSQTHTNWEWIIVDDSGDDGHSFRKFSSILTDPRVRLIHSNKRSGYIGSVKRQAADQCQGQILVELDHDDELTSECLEKFLNGFRQHPECGFGFGEAAEVYEKTKESHWYGWDAGFGFIVYWRQFDPETRTVLDVMRTASINTKTVKHLVGLPNHPRAWTREAYYQAGGHRPNLSVADDYDLIIRSLLSTRALRIQDLMYRQYRNKDLVNQSVARNEQIQLLCEVLESGFRHRIQTRLEDLGLPSLEDEPYCRVWMNEPDHPAYCSAEVVSQECQRRDSFLQLVSYKDEERDVQQLRQTIHHCKTRDWKDCEIIAVGNCPIRLLEHTARNAPSGSVRWWVTPAEWSSEATLRYGKLLCTGQVNYNRLTSLF